MEIFVYHFGLLRKSGSHSFPLYVPFFQSIGNPESALLNLGRIMEIWLLIRLNHSNSPGLSLLIRHAEIEKLIDKHQSKLLGNINDEYNKLKHYRQHTIDEKKIDTFIKDFNSIFYRK